VVQRPSDYRDRQWNLDVASAAVVGIGNVAIDVARLLCLTREELLASDAADYAVEALSHSQIKTVYLLGRRARRRPLSAIRIKEVGDLAEADIVTRADETQLDSSAPPQLRTIAQAKPKWNLQSYAREHALTKPRRLNLRFLVSPVNCSAMPRRVAKMKLVRNTLVASETGSLSAKATDQFEEIEAGLVFRSVGYRGVLLPEVPFHDRWGVILNERAA